MTTISTTIRAGRHWHLVGRVRVLAVLAAIIVAISLTSGAALAEPKPTPDPVNYLSKDVRTKMEAQQPLTTAASLIQWSVERGNSTGYAGIGLGVDEVVVWWKGALPPAVGDAVADARRTASVRMAAAAHSRAELEAAAKGIANYVRVHPRSPYHRVDIAYDGSGLVVNTDPDQMLPVSLPADMKVPAGIRVSIAKRERLQLAGPGNYLKYLLASRMDDFAPYWGGGRIINTDYGGGCTAGFPVTAGGAQYMLTAGHCGRPGAVWTNGVGTRYFGTGAYENVEHDVLLISANVGGRIWDGGVGSGEFSKGVADWGWVFPGEWLCTSGSVTGALCGHIVSNDFTFMNCATDGYGNNECYYDLILAYRLDGETAVRPGDSGGPVFGLSGSDRVIAKGTITGSGNVTELVFQDFATAWRDSCNTPALGCITPVTG